MGKQQSLAAGGEAHWSHSLDTADAELAGARAIVDLLYCATIDLSGTAIAALDEGTLCDVMRQVLDRLDKAQAALGAVPRVVMAQ
jgi:hypothetical protein